MTPDQISALGSIAIILKTVGNLPVSLVLIFIFIGPWAALAGVVTAQGKRAGRDNQRLNTAVAKQNERVNRAIAEQNERINSALLDFKDKVGDLAEGQKERFEAVVRMYENNVEMVRDYHRLADDLTGIITLTTRTLEGLVQKVDNNMFCPVARAKGGKD